MFLPSDGRNWRLSMNARFKRSVPRTLPILALCLAGAFIAFVAIAAEPAATIPPPAVDETIAPNATSEVAVLAGGCFWGVQGVFQHVEGVVSTVSGYAGGAQDTAHYEIV